MDLSIIIVSYNTKKLTLECIDSIISNTKGINYEIIVVDNGSTDGTTEELKNRITRPETVKTQKLKLIENKKNLGFAAANNQGWKVAKGDYILFLNSDTEIGNNVLGQMVAWMDKSPEVGVATCSLKNKDESLQGTGGYFPSLISVFSWMTIQDLPFVDFVIPPFHPMHSKSILFKGSFFFKKKRELDWITGAFLLTRRKILEDVGGWDEKYFMYVEEVDLCFRIKKAGWQVWYLPQWNIIHYGGASGRKELSVIFEFDGLKRFYKKFYPSWQYPLLRLLLKIGALGRAFLFGILEGRYTANIYVKAARYA